MNWPQISAFSDGVSKVDAATLNKPLGQLSERTEALRQEIAGIDRTRVVVDGTIYGNVSVGQPVYRREDGTYAAAQAQSEQNAWFYAASPAMVVGVVAGSGSGTTKPIILSGYISFSDKLVSASSVISDTNPTSGRYYLSAIAGKLTKAPYAPVIYVCDCQISSAGYVTSMIVSPQYRDTGESHIHRSFVIGGMPMGGYSIKSGGSYYAANIVDTAATKSATAFPTGISLILRGAWTGIDSASYSFTISSPTVAGTWGTLTWQVTAGTDIGGVAPIVFEDSTKTWSNNIVVGSRGLYVVVVRPSTSTAPSAASGKTWTVNMPDDARTWTNHSRTVSGETEYSYRMNLGMYPEMARYVPPVPENGAALNADGIELNSNIFKDKTKWRIEPANTDGGPWLYWIGKTADTPFIWDATVAKQKGRDIVLHSNRMRVGPTGFVTSLQAEEGSPIKVRCAQTGADAYNGALMLSLDIDFKTKETGASGHQVVKGINGSEFITGPVVERVVAGTGVLVSPSDGQGTVTVSVSNTSYAGDFETIALKNAKQDLAGNVFPYTKLLGWSSTGQNIDSGFTAKFRVPDNIPYKLYNVVVSASIFGEAAPGYAASAGFSLKPYMLRDYTVNPAATDESSMGGSIASPTPGIQSVIAVDFGADYTAFDPIVVHGFSTLPITAQRQYKERLLLCDASGNAFKVYPGYFIGLDIARCGITGTATWYTQQIGFLSLRWNLVEVQTGG